MSSIDRRSHCLRREKTLAMPREIILFDTETSQQEQPDGSIRQDLKLGWVCRWRRAYGRHIEKLEWLFFTDSLSFWQFVFKCTERKKKLWLISHNLSFDFTVLAGWKHLGQVGFKLKFFHNNGVTCIISVRSKHGSLLFCDSLNWFSESLETIGRRLGIPKLKIDFETASDSFLSVYCRRDVEILLACVKDFIRFLEGNHISRLCYTIGSTAMAAYLLNCYEHKIYIHNNAEAIDLERTSYRGGRTECFYIGELSNGNYYVLDVNSLYPAAMYHGLFPVKYKKMVKGQGLCLDANTLSAFAVIAKVLIRTDEPVYAVKQDRTVFPTGRFWVTLCTPELAYAVEHNHIIKIDSAVLYDTRSIFKWYVEKFYTLRQDFKSAGVSSYEQICKLLLNSLYGKFGQKAEVWKKIGECPNQSDRTETTFFSDTNRRGLIRYLLGEVFELTGYEESFNSFPAISSHVTAYGRMFLWRLMQLAGRGNYFYCDTDSLVVNEKGLSNLSGFLNDTNLGCLKIVERTSKMIIRGLKDYSTDTKTVIKGIKKNATEVSEGVYSQEVWPTLRGMLSTGSTEVYTVKRQTKTLSRKYTKGIVNPSGWTTPPALADPFEPLLWPSRPF